MKRFDPSRQAHIEPDGRWCRQTAVHQPARNFVNGALEDGAHKLAMEIVGSSLVEQLVARMGAIPVLPRSGDGHCRDLDAVFPSPILDLRAELLN